MQAKNQWVAFDLDGTLLNDQKKVSIEDLNTLVKLGKKKMLRIAATGRNLYSLNKLLPPDFPMDYAIFSSGAGIMDWKSKKILHTQHLNASEINLVLEILLKSKLNFSINKPIPENHHMLLHAPHPLAHDLINYTLFYKEFVEPLTVYKIPILATQFIVLLNNHVHLYDYFSTQLKNVKTILTTSPIDKKSMWMEIFHKNVSKAKGIQWLANYLNIINPELTCVGNDYNDLDMLNLSSKSFVVANAPESIKNQFKVVKDNNNSGFSEAVYNLF